jgi:hypothetical protein
MRAVLVASMTIERSLIVFELMGQIDYLGPFL